MDNASAGPQCNFNEKTANLVIPALYFLSFFPALLLNGMAAWISLSLPEKSTFIVYLKNLIAADLIMTLCLPLRAASSLQEVPIGLKEFACRYSNVLLYFSMYMSILLMGLISLDRFYTTVRPAWGGFSQNLVFGRVLSTSIWIILFCTTALPTVILTDQKLTVVTASCMSQKSEVGKKLHNYVVLINLLIFCVVCILVFVCYICIAKRVFQSYRDSRSSNDSMPQKTKARVFIILAVFVICFLPYHALRIPYTLIQIQDNETCKRASLRVTKRFLLWLSSTNTCLDPLIYIFLSRAFRKRLFEMWTFGPFTSAHERWDTASMNVSQANSTKCARDTTVTSVVFPCLYSVLFLLALVLNSLAAWIFFQIPSTSTFVVYLKNVVVADLLMTFTVLVKVLSDSGVGSWRLKAFYCRYSAVLFYTTMYISILLLGLISLDRCLKIVRPFGKCFLRRVGFGKGLSVAVWAVMLSLALPNVVLSNQEPIPSTKLRCTSMKGHAGLRWHEGHNYFCQVVFWGTLALMVVCYTCISRKVYESLQASRSSSKGVTRRTNAKVFIVVVVFFVCFAPFHFARVPYTLTQTRNANPCWVQNQLYIAKETTLWLSAANICLDPLIYVFLCRMFRRKLTAALSRSPESPTETSTKLEMSNIVHIRHLTTEQMERTGDSSQ
ncbi:hypothetical protein AAFF_G00186570 [Aldrovandia affinis]|uniref:G-protein coupled receptors family 1 profile domain-containing protein n=1 Tax=Aldrovandia affinis TaxID=143900 RepID=A0AAD7WVN4_9TELE|nr:hypothetical protein AAFF_G00186570 [Aldrovandia affinis]